MIPKTIWQTYIHPFNQLPQYAKDCIITWQNLNPEYKYIYMDNNDCRSFILHEHGQEWLDIFDSCPIGVMKGDIWRYLVLYSYGGVYADIDTICLKPIKKWIKDEYDATICEDDIPGTYNQLTIISKPNSIILTNVLKLIKDAFKNPDYNDANFVDNLTGVNIWTKAIKNTKDLSKIFIYPENKNIYLAKNEAIYFDQSIKHLTASINWNDGNYVRWQKEVSDLLGKHDS